MGAIQQAFNQSLAIGALAAHPTAQHKKEVVSAKKGAKIAGEQFDKIASTGKASGEELDVVSESAESAYKKLYELEPSEKNLKEYSVYKENLEEMRNPSTGDPQRVAYEKAFKAATGTQARQDLTREQRNIMTQYMSNIPKSYPIKEVIK